MDNEQKRQELKLEQKVSEVGYDILITANMEPASVKNLSQNMRFVESIMRSMITLVEED